MAHLLQAARVLVGVEAVHDLVAPHLRPDRREMAERVVKGDQAELILEEHGRHAQRGDGPGHCGRDGPAVHADPSRHRRVGHGDHRGRTRLLVLAHDQRAEVGQRGLRPVNRGEAVAGLPVAQPHVVEAGAVRLAAVVADGDLAQPPQDEQLDLRDVVQAHERGRLLVVARVVQRLRACGPGQRWLVAVHGTGTRSMMSLITISVVRPWLAAWGPSQSRWPST